jgi:hypothetical protein
VTHAHAALLAAALLAGAGCKEKPVEKPARRPTYSHAEDDGFRRFFCSLTDIPEGATLEQIRVAASLPPSASRQVIMLVPTLELTAALMQQKNPTLNPHKFYTLVADPNGPLGDVPVELTVENASHLGSVEVGEIKLSWINEASEKMVFDFGWYDVGGSESVTFSRFESGSEEADLVLSGSCSQYNSINFAAQPAEVAQ